MSKGLTSNRDLFQRIKRIENALRSAGIKEHAARPITTWIDFDLPLGNQWIPFGGSYSNPGYFKDSNGMVHLRGVMKNGTVGVVYTMPAGYIPSDQVVTSCYGAGAQTCRIDIHTSGDVEIVSPGVDNSLLSLDGVYFRAAQ